MEKVKGEKKETTNERERDRRREREKIERQLHIQEEKDTDRQMKRGVIPLLISIINVYN